MKTYTALEVAQMIKDDEVIYIGYFNYYGKEITIDRKVQKWGFNPKCPTKCAVGYFKEVSAKKCNIQFVKCEDGYESLFVHELRKER